MLKKMGISNPEKTSKCVKRAIMFGHIKITGIKEDLNQIILEGDGKVFFFSTNPLRQKN